MTRPAVNRPPVVVMETDANPVSAGGGVAGWVSGSPAALADGAGATVVFDLGPDWQQYVVAQIVVLSTAAGGSLSAIQDYGSDTPGITSARRMKEALAAGSTTTFLTVTSAVGPQAHYVRPIGRYVVMSMTNTATFGAQGAGAKVTLAAYPS